MNDHTDQAGDVVAGELVAEGDGPGRDVEPYVTEDGEVMLRGEAALRLREMLAAVPVDDEGGNQRIAEQLLSGDGLFDLNNPWESSSGRTLAGKTIRIETLRAVESQYPHGLRAFLVVQGIDSQTGDEVVMTTSALAVVIQLARANFEHWLPAWAEVVVSARPTKRGFYPYHLRFVPPPKGARK